MYRGIDTLGGAAYPNEVIAVSKEGAAIGLFRHWGKKNSDNLALQLLKRRRKFLRTQLAPFDYDHDYPLGKYLGSAIEGAKLYQQFANKYPKTDVYISPFCEHRHGVATMGTIFKDLKKIAPNCKLVNSILGNSYYEIPGVVLELHIENSHELPKEPRGPYGISFDGFGSDGDADFPDVDVPGILKKYPKALYVLVWNWRCNLRSSHEDKIPIDQRKTNPDFNYLVGHYLHAFPREGSVAWKKGLYKSIADDHGKSLATSKDCKAMCILPERVRFIDVLDKSGNKIDTMNRYPGDHELGARYYSKRTNYELAQLARKKTKSNLIKIRVGNVVYPATDAIFRSGMFR